MSGEREELHREAAILSRYLLGRSPGKRQQALYAEAVGKLDAPFGRSEAMLWRLMMRFPVSIRCIDTALALTEPHHPARRRIFTMLAILEASPAFAGDFLPRRFSLFYLLRVVATLLFAFALFPAGYFVVLLVKAKCK